MILLPFYHGKRAGVFGLGKAGQAAVDALLASGAEVYAWDDKEASREPIAKQQHVALHVARIESWPWEGLAALILSPGIPLTHPAPHPVVEQAHEARCPVLGEVELLYQACPQARYIGVTGTNGKSTTTTLIQHLLAGCGVKAEAGGNLGTPALALQPFGAEGSYVIEMSSYQLDLVRSTRFQIAVMLNLTQDHLDRHGDMEGYRKAKMRLFHRQQKEDVAIIAVDDQHTAAMAKELSTSPRKVVTLSTTGGAASITVEQGKLTDHESKFTFELSGIASLTGRHNWQNAAAAYAAAKVCGIAPAKIAEAMKSFAGLAHRMELVETIKNARFVNDSKATNADATQHALAAYENIYWIAGGKIKEGGIVSLAPLFGHVAHAFLIGEAEAEFARTLEGKVPYTRCGTLAKATGQAAEMAWREGKKDAVVLLSPSCASFDQWKNFEERGDAFREQVLALKNKKG